MDRNVFNRKREAARLRQQERRRRLWDEQPEMARRSNAARQREARANLTLERRLAILRNNAEQHQVARESLTHERREEILRHDAEQHRVARENLTQERRNEIFQINAEQHRVARENSTQERKDETFQQNVFAHRLVSMTPAVTRPASTGLRQSRREGKEQLSMLLLVLLTLSSTLAEPPSEPWTSRNLLQAEHYDGSYDGDALEEERVYPSDLVEEVMKSDDPNVAGEDLSLPESINTLKEKKDTLGFLGARGRTLDDGERYAETSMAQKRKTYGFLGVRGKKAPLGEQTVVAFENMGMWDAPSCGKSRCQKKHRC
ncbi:hypothetical protein FHG87_023551 [Trinorchestia longiramus]|nr:hypothetical protein FHG87_023551 [Trinorchestia longiramus]